MSLLIILGGIGFPILVNFKEIIFYRFRMLFGKKGKIRAKSVHIYNLNTRIVVVMTALLLFSGTFFFLTFEWNNAFAGMTVAQKWTHAFLIPLVRDRPVFQVLIFPFLVYNPYSFIYYLCGLEEEHSQPQAALK